MLLTEDEKAINKIFARADAGDNYLRLVGEELRAYTDRLETISRQHRRKMPIRDITFQEEFRDSVAELRAAADNACDIWQEARNYYNSADKADFVRQHRLMIKKLKALALSLSRQSDEVYTTFKNLNSLGKELPLRLNWWLFESSCDDLQKISGTMLFLTRDMEKHYE